MKIVFKCVFLVFILSGCSDFVVSHGTFGAFEATLYRSPAVEEAQSADDIARSSFVAVNAMVAMGNKYDISEYKNKEMISGIVQHVDVFVVTTDEYPLYCPYFTPTLGCFQGDSIVLKEKNGYNCMNRYTVGHEISHKILDGLGVDIVENSRHSTPHVFAWNPDDSVSGWNPDTIEQTIKDDPMSSCFWEE